MKKLFPIFFLLASPCFGQAWSNFLGPSRAVDWRSGLAVKTVRQQLVLHAMKKFGILLILALTFGCLSTYSQGTFTAASCNRSDVNAVINGPTHTAVNGDTIIIPAGSCTWTTGISVSGVGIDITGTGTPNTGGGTFGAGTSNVTITDHANGPLFTFQNLTRGETAKLELLTLSGTGGTSHPEALLFAGTCTTISPYCASIRVDNITFATGTWAGDLSFGFITTSNVFGVIDHNSASETCVNGCPGASVLVTPNFGSWQGISNYGDNSFASPDTFGTAQQIYIENNLLSGLRGTDVPGGSPSESDWGGARYVCRFNQFTIMSQSGMCPSHGTAWSGPMRGVRQEEIYYNTAAAMGAGGYSCIALSNMLGGAGYYFSNTMNNIGCQHALDIDIPRFEMNSGPWNACNGAQPWDQSPWSSAAQCIDQPGTGQGLLLQGNPPVLASAPGSPCNTAGQCWPNAASDPVYEAGETASGGFSGSIIYGLSSGAATRVLANRDYYGEVSTSAQSSPTSPFNGTSGTGYGTLANRPTTCTPHVGYWATDQGTWNTYNTQQGQLFICTSTNTWTLSYTPYTYPHPLVTAGSNPPNPPNPPTGLAATVH